MSEAPWLPAHTGGRRRRRWGRWLALALALVVVVPLVFGAAVTLHGNRSIQRIGVEGLTAHAGGPLHVLIVGSDARDELTPEQRRELTTGSEVGERTDTMFVLSVEGDRAAMLAFPRDLWVERCDGTSQRLNTAVQRGGLGCLAETIEQLSGIPIHHVLEVSFLGFVDIVAAVNGVRMCLPAPISDRDAGIDLPSGCQVLDGRQALGYVRVRKIDDDFGRIGRQQQFLRALAGEIASADVLLDPPQLWRVTGEIGRSLTANEQLGMLDLARIARGFRGISSGRLQALTVPGVPVTRGGAAVLDVAPAAEELFRAFRSGEALDRAGDDLADVSPEDVEVVVRNGAQVPGLAAETRDALAQRGYLVTDIGNAEPTDTTTIIHPPDQQPGAELLASDVEVATGARPVLAPDPSADRIILVLGSDVAD